MNDIVTNAIDRTCIVTGDCKNTDYSKMQNCINDLRLYNDMMADKYFYQQEEELQELRKENQQLKEQLEASEKVRKETIEFIKNDMACIFLCDVSDYTVSKLEKEFLNILDIKENRHES